jgi:hypothetical protein
LMYISLSISAQPHKDGEHSLDVSERSSRRDVGKTLIYWLA